MKTSIRNCVALAIAGTVYQGPVLAEQTPAYGMEEVVVTARRRSENLQDVPLAVSALSGSDLDNRGATDITEIAQIVPSVTLEPSRATNSTLTAFIRGVGQQDPLAGFEQGVALYLDDVYIARPQAALLDVYDVERVEVLRGPQGTLYGRNAVGGAIKYVTRKLDDEFSARVKTQVGSHNQQNLIATVSSPLTDGFRVGATVASLNRDGFGDNKTTGEDNYNKEILAYRLSAEFEPTDNLMLRFAYDHTDDDSNPVAGYRPFPGGVNGDPVLSDVRDTTAGASQAITTVGIGGNNNVESEGLVFSAEWSLNDSYTLKSITSRREDYSESVIDFDSLPSLDFDAPVIYDNEQTSQEFQLLYTGEKINGVAGVYFLDSSASNDFDVVLGLLSPLGITAYTGGTVDTRAWSVFADVSFDVTDKLAVAVGGRYTRDEREADIFRGTYLGFASPFFGNASAIEIAVSSDYEAKNTFSDFSPRLNVSYALTDDVNIYASYTQGFKAGSFDPRGANFLTPSVEKGYDPETLNALEFGWKGALLDGRLRTNIAVFHSDYKDMQIPGSVGVDSDNDGVNDSFVGTVTNAGEAKIMGIEVEAVMMLTDQLRLQFSMSALDAEMVSYVVNGVDIANQREIQNTPERMAYLGLTYSTELLGGSLVAGANVSYKGEITQFEAPAAVIDQDAHEIVNANLVWLSPGENWTVSLLAKNLTDEDVKTAGYCFGSGGCPSTLGLEDNTTVFYGPPRTYAATVEYRL
tara:strand:- start:3822 stop:6068 length:2247 start_codon:yes stop_codon:yes gene_type:complete